MKIGLISDLHLLSKLPENRTDDILEKQWVKLEYVLRTCKEMKISHLLQAGDFFDVPRNWETLHRTITLLQKYPSVRIYCVEGQHDRYMRNDNTVTNLSLLHRLGLVTILKNSIQFGQFVVHGLSFEDNMDINKAIDSIDVSQFDFNILVIHAPISDTPLFDGHECSKANMLIKKHKGFELILCGDIHKSFIMESKGRKIVNTGCMIRKERNEYNRTHEPHFLVYNTDGGNVDIQYIVHNPFNAAFTEQESIVESEVLTEFIEAINSPVSDEMDIYKRIERFVTDNNIEDEVMQEISEVSNAR